MHHVTRTFAASLALPVALASLGAIERVAAQAQTFVSPVGNAMVEGTTGNGFPFASSIPRRYLQIHDDVSGLVGAVRQISFRVSTPAQATTYVGTGTYDIELFVGYSVPFDRVHLDFLTNYISPRTQVIQRRSINFGPQGNVTPPGPQPFQSMDLPFDAPFPFPGSTAIAWEVLVHSATLSGSFGSPDAENTIRVTGTTATVGSGCTITGGSAAMSQTAELYDHGGAVSLAFRLTNGPTSAPVVLALGSRNPALSAPGLCSLLHTDLLLLLPVGNTDATGVIAYGGLATFFLPTAGQGAQLFTQFHAIDAGQPGLPFANSNGLSVSFPASNLTRQPRISRLYTSNGSVTSPRSDYASTGIVSYGLVTQFTY